MGPTKGRCGVDVRSMRGRRGVDVRSMWGGYIEDKQIKDVYEANRCTYMYLLSTILLHTCLALWKHHVNLLFTWCFHKAKQVYCIHHANIQETYILLQLFIKSVRMFVLLIPSHKLFGKCPAR